MPPSHWKESWSEKGSLRPVAQRVVITGGDGHDLVRRAIGGKCHGSPVCLLWEQPAILQRRDINPACLVWIQSQGRSGCFAGHAVGAPVETQSGVNWLTCAVPDEKLRAERGSRRKRQGGIRIRERQHRRAQGPYRCLREVPLFELGVWVVVEHLQDGREWSSLVE